MGTPALHVRCAGHFPHQDIFSLPFLFFLVSFLGYLFFSFIYFSYFPGFFGFRLSGSRVCCALMWSTCVLHVGAYVCFKQKHGCDVLSGGKHKLVYLESTIVLLTETFVCFLVGAQVNFSWEHELVQFISTC